MAGDLNENDDRCLFEALDQYVAALQAGDRERCARWLADFPGLGEFAGCFETLAQFSSPGMDPLPSGVDAREFTRRDFGRYELLEEIGRGGMGVVFKARQRDLHRIVALKMILSNRFSGEEAVKRFHREARAAGA